MLHINIQKTHKQNTETKHRNKTNTDDNTFDIKYTKIKQNKTK